MGGWRWEWSWVTHCLHSADLSTSSQHRRSLYTQSNPQHHVLSAWVATEGSPQTQLCPLICGPPRILASGVGEVRSVAQPPGSPGVTGVSAAAGGPRSSCPASLGTGEETRGHTTCYPPLPPTPNLPGKPCPDTPVIHGNGQSQGREESAHPGGPRGLLGGGGWTAEQSVSRTAGRSLLPGEVEWPRSVGVGRGGGAGEVGVACWAGLDGEGRRRGCGW